MSVASKYNQNYSLSLKSGQIYVPIRVAVVNKGYQNGRNKYGIRIQLGVASADFDYSSYVKHAQGRNLSATTVVDFINSRRTSISDGQSARVLLTALNSYQTGSTVPSSASQNTLVGAIQATAGSNVAPASKPAPALSRDKAIALANTYLAARRAFQEVQNKIQALSAGDQQAVANLIKTFETLV